MYFYMHTFRLTRGYPDRTHVSELGLVGAKSTAGGGFGGVSAYHRDVGGVAIVRLSCCGACKCFQEGSDVGEGWYS